MKRIRKWLVENFGFSNAETKGFLVFLLFSLSFFWASIFLPEKILIRENPNPFLDETDVKQFLSQIDSKKDALHSNVSQKSEIGKFDPNELNYSAWTSLGLSPTLADRIISYRLKGGTFTSKEDLKKIYSFHDTLYEKLKASVYIKEKKHFQKWKNSYSNNYEKKEPYRKMSSNSAPLEMINLNQCDSLDLTLIRGIGEKRASRIIKYREKLGGFHSVVQLKEIYGLDSAILSVLESHTYLSENNELTKIPINTIDFKSLLSHPYFDYSQTRAIINFRTQHGSFDKPEDLLAIKILDKDWVEKITPYINFK